MQGDVVLTLGRVNVCGRIKHGYDVMGHFFNVFKLEIN